MIHLETIKNYFYLKDNKQVLATILSLIIVMFLWSCAGRTYKRIAVSDPLKLVSIKDSLLQSNPTAHIIQSIAMAHEALGKRAIQTGYYEEAKEHFTNALKLSPGDTVYMYYQLMAQGHIFQKSGKKDKLWSSIQAYSKAASVNERAGAPYYYMGNSYHKLGDKDFDLIIESYDKALALELNPGVEKLARKAREKALIREKKLKDFWR